MDVYSSKKFFTHNNVSTSYYVCGAGPVLLFFHGVGSTPKTYHDIVKSLSQYYTVIIPQVPPFGSSTVPPSLWDFRSYGEFFCELIKQEGWKNITIVGHSFGGGIALATAHCCTSNIQCITLFAPAIVPRTESYFQFMPHSFFWPVFFFLLGKPTIKLSIVRYLIPALYPNLFSLHKITRTVARSLRHGSLSIPKNIPIQIVWPKKEEILPHTDVERICSSIPQATIISVNGYHNWIFFNPTEAVEIIRTCDTKLSGIGEKNIP